MYVFLIFQDSTSELWEIKKNIFTKIILLTGQTTLSNGIVIDKASAAYLKKTSKDTDLEDDFGYTLDKLQRKYAKKVKQGCEVIYVCINKGNSGLGIRYGF